MNSADDLGTGLTILGRFCLNNLARFVNVLPPEGTDEAFSRAYGQKDSGVWYSFLESLPFSLQLEAIKWDAVAHHELFHFHHFVGTRTGYNLFHYLTHQNENMEMRLWTPQVEALDQALFRLEIDSWLTIASSHSPIAFGSLVHDRLDSIPAGIFKCQSELGWLYVSFYEDELEKRPIYLGAQRLFENWAYLWELAYVRMTYGKEAYEVFRRSVSTPPLYTTIERLFIRVWPSIEELDAEMKVQFLGRLIVSCLNGEIELEPRDIGKTCGLKLYRMLGLIEGLTKEKKHKPALEDVIELEHRLNSVYGYVTTRKAWSNIELTPDSDWDCSTYHDPKTLYGAIQRDFTGFAKNVSHAAISENIFDSLTDYFNALPRLPKPPMNFIMNDMDGTYDLRLPKSETPLRWFPWILWWFRTSLLGQAASRRIQCPVKSREFFCRTRVPSCGDAHLHNTEPKPVDCLFYRMVEEFETIQSDFDEIKDEWITAIRDGQPLPSRLIKVTYDNAIVAALLRGV